VQTFSLVTVQNQKRTYRSSHPEEGKLLIVVRSCQGRRNRLERERESLY